MKNVWTIAKKEFQHFFISPIAYVFLFVTLITLGIFFYLDLMYAVTTQQFVPDMMRTFEVLAFPIFFLAIPALTMRTISEENKTGTLEIMLTSPVTDAEFVIGKWLGSFLFFLVMIATTLIYAVILNNITQPGIDQLTLISGYVGIILLAASLCAIGVFVSSLFSNSIASLFTTIGIIIIFWIIGSPAQILGAGTASDIFRYLSIPEHFYNTFLYGIISLEDVIYFVSLTSMGLFLGTISVEIRRWK